MALSYFGTDQSQVQRYLAGGTATRSRLGLLFNGVLKVPMQFCILYLGILLFAFYAFSPAPLSFNTQALEAARTSDESAVLALEASLEDAQSELAAAATAFTQDESAATETAFVAAEGRVAALRSEGRTLIESLAPEEESNDSDYVFLSFALKHLPSGLVGLLVAVILSAAMSSTASELNALGTTSTIDLYRRLWARRKTRGADADDGDGGASPKELVAADRRLLRMSRWLTALWGVLALIFALSASLFDNLIEAVNILGSLFYGPILGIFVVAFALRRASSAHVLVATVIGQGAVFGLFFLTDIGYLWFNVVGCLVVVAVAAVLTSALPASKASAD
ncbi:MAG: hypothetical protein AAF411_10280 [Myxococcota bacterium]